MRWLYLLLGHLCVAAGFVGCFLPIIPTVPFVLAASFFYARGSERFHAWLHRSRFGPLIRRWECDGSIPRRAKLAAVSSIAVSVCVSLWLIPKPWVAALVLVVCGTVALYILTRPEPNPRMPEAECKE